MSIQQTSVPMLARINHFIGSNAFFYGVIVFFILNAAWFALVSLYPMAFDENFHVGLIKLYAEVWNPFALVQTTDADIYGSITTDPSYLFHYLMSFPYRFLTLFTSHEQTIIVVLRLLNIALLTAALFVYRNVLLAARVSPAVTHSVLAVFVLIPVLPMMAGQVNYDNLLLLIVAALFWYAIVIRDSLRNAGTVPVIPMVYIGLLILFGAVVKYAFLPIAAGVVLVLLYELVRVLRTQKTEVFRQVIGDIRSLKHSTTVVLVLLAVVGTLLFAQRYVVNLVQYGAIVPDCAAVLNEERCEAYGPWGRDYRYRNDKEGREVVSLPEYVKNHWAYGMWHRLYFTLAGPTNTYATRIQLPTPSVTALVIVAVSFVAVIIYFRRLLRAYPWFVLFLVPSVLYIGVLLMTQYANYVETARPVAINGRYLLPLLPMLGAIGGMALLHAARSLRIVPYMGIAAVIILALLLQGGGALTYMYYAESSWLWQHPLAQNAQDVAQSVVKFLIIGK